MDDFVLTFLKSSAAIWGLFILLLIYARKKGLSFSRQEKNNFYGILIFSVLVAGWFVFFQDLDFIFDCRKETQRCHYYHSTIYNKKMRLHRSYDLTGIREVEVVSRKRSCGRYCTKTVYRIKFKGENSSFEMAKDFDSRKLAQKQAARATTFLQTDKPYYIYKNLMPERAGHDLFFLIAAALSMVYAFVGILVLLVKIFKKE